jgi:two-component system, chemotaxis family, CheB/CheR fusion protein
MSPRQRGTKKARTDRRMRTPRRSAKRHRAKNPPARPKAARRALQKKLTEPKSPSKASRSKPPNENLARPIVAIGGSAGGFEATMELLKELPSRNGMAFVVVQHLDPHHASRLATLLGRATQMRVVEISGRVRPEPNTVYVLPPNNCVFCRNGTLTLARRAEQPNIAIDQFFESLAEDQGPRAIGVVLSGTGSDGTAGLRAIKAAGGITFAQSEETAKFPAMPHNAVASGFVDAVLSPKGIAAELRRIAEHPYIRRTPHEPGEAEPERRLLDDLSNIFQLLKKHTGVDFSAYKQSTLERRIHRRMAIHRLDRIRQYLNFLRTDAKEIRALFNDLLINVTRFFRDEHAFRALQKRFLPALIKQKGRRGDLRIWVPGCATGEEVYSLAICVLEVLGADISRIRLQIFGTDLSEAAIDRARLGVYSSAIEKDVSRERLQTFFKKLDSTYQINRSVRDLCTFARQNITADPPFSRLDLISCRNVLIYLGPQLQKRAMPIFHYALNPGGYLILGPSETIGLFSDMFELVDKKSKIYAKKVLPGRPDLDVDPYVGYAEIKTLAPPQLAPMSDGRDFNSQIQKVADRILLGNYAPAGVVIDEDLTVKQFRGRTSDYLEHVTGPANLSLLHMAKPSLIPDLRAAVHRALRTGQPSRKERALFKRDGHAAEVNIEVVPFKVPNSDKTWALVIFHEEPKSPKKSVAGSKKKPKNVDVSDIQQLRDELGATKESLQAIIEEQEATNEELKSANEEIESSNEELQSTNEELETAKEELQSTNEELTTLNEELSNRNLEIMQINSDLSNLLSSINIPIVMVDNNLTIRRATPTARDAFNISDIDIGRRMTELKPNIDVPDIDKLLRQVINTLAVREREVQDNSGRRFSLRIRPYRTGDNKIDGAVLTLVDVASNAGEKK